MSIQTSKQLLRQQIKRATTRYHKAGNQTAYACVKFAPVYQPKDILVDRLLDFETTTLRDVQGYLGI